MAGLMLMDGVNNASVLDFQTDVTSADVTAANMTGGTFPASAFNTSGGADSWKCTADYVSLDITQRMIERTTFCAGGWVGRFAGLKDLAGRIDGFLSQGSKISNPFYMFSVAGAIPWMATLATGCTISALIRAARYHLGMRVQANSEMGMEFMSDGTYIQPSCAWITS